MKILQNYKIIRRINKLIKNGELSPLKYSSSSNTAAAKTITAESKEPNDVYIVSSTSNPILVLEYNALFDTVSNVPGRAEYSVTIHDPNFKILNKKTFPKGELSEEKTHLSRLIFNRLSKLYFYEKSKGF